VTTIRAFATHGAAMETESGIQQHYAAARAGVTDGTRIAVLHIGTHQTVLANGHDAVPTSVLALPIGSKITASRYFQYHLPTPAEIETAIHAIEDEVVRTRSLITGRSTLFTTDHAIRDIARMAGTADQPEMTLNLDALERVFARLAAVTLGRPASREEIPEDPAFAATLLIVREFMHHLEFPAIRITTNAAQRDPA